MKIPHQFKKNQGIALILVCLGAAVIIGFPLTYYLTTVQGESATVARSQVWNDAMVTAEAGVEEGMALVNKYVSSGTSLSSWPNTAVSDGWTQNGSTYTLTRNLGAGRYTVIVTPSGSAATIKSTGTVTNVNIWSQQSGVTISRAVQVTAAATGSSAFGGAILTQQGIAFSGGGFIDSFNSQNPLYSSNGMYSFSRHEAHGDIMTDASNVVLTTEISLSGSSHVWGHIYTGPDSTVQYSGSATVGDTNWASGSGLETGWVNNTANIPMPQPPPIPSVPWQSMPSEQQIQMLVNGQPKNVNAYILNGGGPGQTAYYYTPKNGFNLNDYIIVTNGNIALDAQGQFQLSGSSAVIISPGANLTAWFDGQQAQLSGSGIINNAGNVTNVTIYGTTNLVQLQLSGSSELIASILAPQAVIQYSGSSDFVGSLVGYSLAVSGSGNIHYDEALKNPNSAAASYIVTSWAEVPP